MSRFITPILCNEQQNYVPGHWLCILDLSMCVNLWHSLCAYLVIVVCDCTALLQNICKMSTPVVPVSVVHCQYQLLEQPPGLVFQQTLL